MSEFEQACRARNIALYVLPPRSPKLNGRVERAHRTHLEEFYEVTDAEPTLADLRPKLRAWETIYNTVRPHQALGYKTPLQFLQASDQHQPRKEECTGGTERVHALALPPPTCYTSMRGRPASRKSGVDPLFLLE